MSAKKALRKKSLSLCEDYPTRGKLLFSSGTKRVEDTGRIFKYIDDNIIGKGLVFLGPFGRRKLVYADYASTGRSLQFFEDYVIKEVLPGQGDVSCASSLTGLQTNIFNNETKDLIKTAVKASDDDRILICDSNTCPAEKLCYMLCYQNIYSLDKETVDNELINKPNPVLFVSICEPENTLQPWLNIGVEIVRITKTKEGYLDLDDLESKLKIYENTERKLFGLFSGASRLTGILADDVATTILLHQYGAISIWDYSPAAPYSDINMNPALPGAFKDAIYFSSDKFIGGLQAPGILIVKKYLVPESQTPINDNIGMVSSVRAGLVIHLKESIGVDTIMYRQEKLCKQILSHIRTIPEIVLLGPQNTTANRIPTICFLVRHPRGAFLHHRFVVAILNDMFGIQATAGNHLGEALGLSKKLIVEYERVFMGSSNLTELASLKPGFTRLSIPYFMGDNEVGFILEALKMVATEAWKLLPMYVVDKVSAEWKHNSNALAKDRKSLSSIRYTDGRMQFSDRRISGPGTYPQTYADCLQTARNVFSAARKTAHKNKTVALTLKLPTTALEDLRWYMLPDEAHELLLGHSQNIKHAVPFHPQINMDLPFQLNHRHYSLSALDVKKMCKRSMSVTPDNNYPRQLSSPSPLRSPSIQSNSEAVTSPILRFSLGGEVTTFANFAFPAVQNIIRNETNGSGRNRCNSWSSTGTVNKLSPQTRMNLGLLSQVDYGRQRKQRYCSCSSQTEMDHPIMLEEDLEIDLNISPTPSPQANSMAGSMSDKEDIQNYVEEMTKEIATELKSEIREVISKVEDALDGSDSPSLSSFPINGDDFNVMKDAVSATDVAEYLKEYSKDMASEMKSEIREAFSDIGSPKSSNNMIRTPTNENHRFSDSIQRLFSPSPGKMPTSDLSRPISHSKRPHPSNIHLTTAASPECSTPECPYTGTISKQLECPRNSSQDSGINLYFTDQDDLKAKTSGTILPKNSYPKTLSFSHCESTDLSDRNSLSFDEIVPEPNLIDPLLMQKRLLLKKRSSESDSIDGSFANWQQFPKDIWKPTAEAIDDFNMVTDGDKVLVCLSGTASSLCLLHAIRQFSRARGRQVQMCAVTIGQTEVDPRALMIYLKELDVPYMIEELTSYETIRTKLYSAARHMHCNVLAMGDTVEKLANEFLNSVLYRGQLNSLQPHTLNGERDLRIIRPFVYVRNWLLDEFSKHKGMPVRTSKNINLIETSGLLGNAISNPIIYDNVRNAIRPLLSFKYKENLSMSSLE